jgi:hypothetical protein
VHKGTAAVTRRTGPSFHDIVRNFELLMPSTIIEIRIKIPIRMSSVTEIPPPVLFFNRLNSFHDRYNIKAVVIPNKRIIIVPPPAIPPDILEMMWCVL